MEYKIAISDMLLFGMFTLALLTYVGNMYRKK